MYSLVFKPPCRAELSGSAASGSSLPLVGCEDIEAVVAAWTGIPMERMAENEKEKLLRLVSKHTLKHARGFDKGRKTGVPP